TGPRWPRTCETIRCRTRKPAVGCELSMSQVATAGAMVGAGTEEEAADDCSNVVAVLMVVCPFTLTMGAARSFDKWMIVMHDIRQMNMAAINLNLMQVLDALLLERSERR